MAAFWVGTTLTIKAATTSETSVNLYQTTGRNNPEDSRLHVYFITIELMKGL
jgi:hypothetical protein